MKRYKYLYALWLLALIGCQALGIPQPDTFNEKIAVAYTDVTAVRAITASLVSAGKINPDDAQNIQVQADNARAAIEIARQAYRGGDAISANNKLASASTILTALQAYLRSKQ